jgi:type IV pilus assembly protein PilW
MSAMKERNRRNRSRRQHGFTLIELMISMAVGLFLVGGLLTILQNMGNTRTTQTLLAQLQDSQRVAMTMVTDVVQSTGYFPDPTTNTNLTALPTTMVGAATLSAGQALYGTRQTADPGDSLTVRFMDQSNNIINCIGGTNTTGAPVRYLNTFSVTGGQLVCSLNGAAASPLVSGLKRMDVWYGVKRDLTVDNTNVDTYLTADQLAASDWLNVSSVKVRLTFNNPLAGRPGQPATIRFMRTIAIMSRAGVKT